MFLSIISEIKQKVKQWRNEKAHQKNEEHKLINVRPEIWVLTVFRVLNLARSVSRFFSVPMSKLRSKVSCRFLPASEGFSPASSAATHAAHWRKSADCSLRGSSRHSTDISAIPPAFVFALPFTKKHENRRWSQEGPLEILPSVLRDCSWFGQ